MKIHVDLRQDKLFVSPEVPDLRFQLREPTALLKYNGSSLEYKIPCCKMWPSVSVSIEKL